MSEWKRIFSNRKWRITVLCIPIICLAIFFYQKCNGNFGKLISDAQEYRTLLQTYSMCTPDEIVDTFPDVWILSEHENRLLEQAKHLKEYPGYLKRIQEQACKMQVSSLFNGDRDSFVFRNILKTAKDFERCTADNVQLGNDRAMRNWLEFTFADWCFLAAILLLVMSFLEEKEKGLCAIIRTCPAGRGKLQLSRIVILALYCMGMAMLLYYLPLVMSLCLDGGWQDLSRPVQSLVEFQKCTVQMSVAGFLLRFLLVKIACGLLVGLLTWFLLSFLEQIQLRWLLTTSGLVIEYLLYQFIPAQSVFSPLRYVNIFSYVFSAQLYTDYVNINFFSFPVERRSLLLILLVLVVVSLSLATVLLMTKRYPFGNKDVLSKWLKRWNQLGDVIRSKLSLYGFEWYKLLFLSAGGLFLVMGILLTQDIRCNSGAYNRLEDLVYRQYIAEVQGPVTQETFNYLAEVRQTLVSSELDTTDFEMALDRLEQTIDDLADGAWIVDETVFLNIYGSEAWRAQRNNGLTALMILVACLSPLYACEHNNDVLKVIRSTPNGRRKLFWAKYAVGVSVAFCVWLMVFAQEWNAAIELLGDDILSAPCNSIKMLNSFPMTIGEFVALLYVVKGVALLIPTNVCIFIIERSNGYEKAFLISGFMLLLPAAAYRFGANALKVVTPLSFLSDGNLLFSVTDGLIAFSCWIAISFLALLAAERHWCQLS